MSSIKKNTKVILDIRRISNYNKNNLTIVRLQENDMRENFYCLVLIFAAIFLIWIVVWIKGLEVKMPVKKYDIGIMTIYRENGVKLS